MISVLTNIPKQKLTTILKILNSRRLLSDHCEVLEECLCHVSEWSQVSSTGKCFNGICCSVLITSALLTTKFISTRLGITLGAISSGYTIGCLSKFLIERKSCNFHKSVNDILTTIDRFDACMRRNISYFRENSLFQSTHQSTTNNIDTITKELASCATSLIAVIESIHDITRSLESSSAPSKVDVLQPLENLSECQYFQEACAEPILSNLKDLYNIFLYIQSHFLTRLSLFLLNHPPESLLLPKNECSSLSRMINGEICKDDLRHEQLTPNLIVTNSHSIAADHITTEPMANLKNYSISVTSKILAIANECRRIDASVQCVNNIQNDELKRLMPLINQIENAIYLCQNDYQRFVVAYHKVINVEYNIRSSEELNQEDDEFTLDTLNLNELKEVDEKEEEFFTSTERTEDDDLKVNSNRTFCDEELTARNINLVKQRFKPVLAQLRNKIEPIAVSLRQREMNYLMSKGIDPSEFLDCNNISKDVNNSSDSDEAETEYVRPKKTNKSYDDMRKFLEGKTQISLIPFRSANDSFMKEDVLE